jgi:hypothetical protein
MHLIDEMGNDVPDYQIAFHVIDDTITVNTLDPANLAKLQQYQELTERLQKYVIVDAQRHTVNHSYRTFFVNIDAYNVLQKEIDGYNAQQKEAAKCIYIAMNIDAVGPTPDLTYNTDDLQYIPVFGKSAVDDQKQTTFFEPNTTTLLEITINRMADNQIFDILFDAR